MDLRTGAGGYCYDFIFSQLARDHCFVPMVENQNLKRDNPRCNQVSENNISVKLFSLEFNHLIDYFMNTCTMPLILVPIDYFMKFRNDSSNSCGTSQHRGLLVRFQG